MVLFQGVSKSALESGTSTRVRRYLQGILALCQPSQGGGLCTYLTDEYKGMALTVNRIAGHIKYTKKTDFEDQIHDSKMSMAYALYFIFDHRLLAEGRGVRLCGLSKNRAHYEGSVAYVVRKIGGELGPSRSSEVLLPDYPETTLKLRSDQMRLILLNDPRHWNGSLEFDPNPSKVFPPEKDAEECDRHRQYIPLLKGHRWQYKDLDTQEWMDNNKYVNSSIESLYDMGSHHFRSVLWEVGDRRMRIALLRAPNCLFLNHPAPG